ncbi:MAG TPA: dienelactone hydrolase family protein [Jatrophihabitantaceae bacterium]|jgi:carboxymethylenebutenolidase|nr:dienelactone hydrolase family protein [Jatrophihabitantaceae bacterium]
MDEQISTQWIRLGGGPDAYVAVPRDRDPVGAVVAGAEMFGFTGHTRAVCDTLANAGYAVVAPDFYWRDTRRPTLGYDDAGRAEARRLMGGLRRDGVLADVGAALDEATTRAGRGGTAVVGLSMVGHVAVLAATRFPLDLAVAFYGGWTLHGGIPLADPPPLDDAAKITAFVLAFIGGRDFLVSQDEWHAIDERLTAAGVPHELVTYPDAAHGFANDERPDTYDAPSASDAWRRTLEALRVRVAA